MMSTSRAKMYPPLSLSCGSKVVREIIARKEGGAWELSTDGAFYAPMQSTNILQLKTFLYCYNYAERILYAIGHS